MPRGLLISVKLTPCSRLCGLSGRGRVGDGLGGEPFSEEPGKWGNRVPSMLWSRLVSSLLLLTLPFPTLVLAACHFPRELPLCILDTLVQPRRPAGLLRVPEVPAGSVRGARPGGARPSMLHCA